MAPKLPPSNYDKDIMPEFKSLQRMQSCPVMANMELKAMAREFPTVFRLDDEPMTVSTLFAHRIRLKDDIPVYRKPYSIPMKLQSQVDTQLQQMLKDAKFKKNSFIALLKSIDESTEN